MVILTFYLSVNFLLFMLMAIDKKKSIKNKWRISEKTFFLLSFLGGALGGLFGMYIFHHKTKHIKFKIGFPTMLILNLTILYLAFTF